MTRKKSSQEISKSLNACFSCVTSEPNLCNSILFPEDYTDVITLTATLDSPLPSARISNAVPSYTSPNAPLPNNLCRFNLSREKAGNDSISAWEGRVLQNINTSHLLIVRNAWHYIKFFLIWIWCYLTHELHLGGVWVTPECSGISWKTPCLLPSLFTCVCC